MYAHDQVKPFDNREGSKKEQVASMFDEIAFRYDFLNRFLSGGIDLSWRKKAIRELLPVNPSLLLDVATGTADMAILAKKILPGLQRVEGIDISEGMLSLGRKKLAEQKLDSAIRLSQGDSEAINFPDASFDAVMVAFGVRNFANLEMGLSEMRRVLKPGGKLVVLEFSKPHLSVVKQLYQWYTNLVAPTAGKMIARHEAAYRYLNDSIQAFPEGNHFLEIMQKTGYTHTYKKPLTLGICTIYCGSQAS